MTVGRQASSAIASNTACVSLLGGCAPIPESDLEERSLDDSTEMFTNHKHLMAEPPVPGKGVSEAVTLTVVLN